MEVERKEMNRTEIMPCHDMEKKGGKKNDETKC